MKITVLTPHLQNPWSNLGDIYIALGIAHLFAEHEIDWLPLHKRPSPEDIAKVQRSDVLVIGGSNLIGAMGTVRMGWRKEDIECLSIPIMPLALGAQAATGKSPAVDKAGRQLLDAIAAKSLAFSVRDELTAKYLANRYGTEKVVLTGCTAMLAPSGMERAHGNDRVLCTGILVPSLAMDKNVHYWQTLLACAKKSNATHITGHQAESVHFARLLEHPVELYGNDYRKALARIASAELLISGRIHAAICAVQCGVPSVVFATDERCVSMAHTHGIPCVPWQPGIKVDDLAADVIRALSFYDQSRVDACTKQLRGQMESFLGRYGIAYAPSDSISALPVDPAVPAKGGMWVSYAVACAKRFPFLYPLMKFGHRLIGKR